MGGLSVDGLVSGLDTTSLVNQLIQLERNPQRRLQARQADLRNTVQNFTDLSNRFKAIFEAAKALSTASGWNVRSASSSDEDVATVKASGGAPIGSLSFTVDALAKSHTVISASTVAGTDAVVADGTDIVVNGTTITAAEYGGGTLEEVVAAINAADAGVTAAAVQVSPGNYRLQLAAESSGADGTFTVGGTGLTTALGSFGIVSQGTDARITVGDGAAAYSVTSTTNAFEDVLPGVTITAKKTGAASVTVGADAEAIADKVAKMVSAMNDVKKFIGDRSKYNAETGAVGVFLGQSMPSQLSTSVTNALIDPVSGSGLVGGSVGITTDRNGAISFDREAFLEAYADDPAAVQAFFTENADGTADDGIAERLRIVADDATRVSTGRITSFIDGRNERIKDMDDDIAAWDVRLELREAALRRQFTTLETVLGRLQNQSQWLAGTLASLPQMNSGA